MADGARVVRLGPYPGREGEELGLLVEPGAEPRVVRVAWLPGVDPEARAALAREVDRAAEALHHPHIQPPVALEEIDGRLAMVLDHAEGETLAEILAVGGRMPPPIAARVVRDACRAIHFAHEEGQDDGLHLHGWLRPANVLVTRNGVTLVSGFGVGLARAPADLLPWQSPEQILGGPHAASRASDVYCLGLLLHAALSGENPFAREPDPDVAILSRPAPSLEPLGVPPGLAAVARRALSVKGADRFPTAAEMGKAIDDCDVKVASPAEVAAWVGSLFPAGMGMRALRQRAAEAAREAARSPAAAGEPPATVVDVEEVDGTVEAERPEPLGAEPPVQPPTAVPVRAPGPAPAHREAPAEPELFPGDFVAVGPAFLGGRNAATSRAANPAAVPAAIPPGAATPALEDELPELEEVAPAAVSAHPAAPVAEARSPAPRPAAAGAPVASGPSGEAPARQPTPVPDPAEPRPASPAVEPPPPPPPARRGAGRALAGVALAAAVGGAVGWWFAGSGREGAHVAPAGPVAAVPQAAPPAPATEAPALPGAPAAQAAPVPASPAPAPPPAEAVAGRPVLEITSSSPGDLIVDGRRAGRPPYSHPVRGGRHEVRLVNRALGFDVSRKVDVRPPRTALRIEVGKGRLTVAAPSGADIFLDGRLVGRGQLKDLEIWEGRHQLLVRLGAAQNEHDFEVGPQETYEYEVTAQVRP